MDDFIRIYGKLRFDHFGEIARDINEAARSTNYELLVWAVHVHLACAFAQGVTFGRELEQAQAAADGEGFHVCDED